MGFFMWDNENFHHLYIQYAERKAHRKYEYVSNDEFVRVLSLVFGFDSALFSITIMQPYAKFL